ncbi:MAG: transposase [Phycisphaeraceae bacterium]|nr:MAG: transposase [Phycisphaeraceae bacterium]
MSEHRKRLKRIEHPNHVRFLTFSCYRRLPLFDNDSIKDAFVEHVGACRARTNFLLHAWVIMPEHVHMMIWPDLPEFPVPKVTWTLRRGFARTVIGRWRELGAPILDRLRSPDGRIRFWQPGGGYDRNIIGGDELDEKVGYIHENPVRRGLVSRPTDWAWSSARRYSGDREGQLHIDPAVGRPG